MQELPTPAAAATSPAGRPRPGGRKPAPAPPAHDTMASEPAAAEAPPAGPGLVTPAMPLLQLMARLRTMATQPDPAALLERTEADVQAFASRAEKAGIAPDLIRRGSYVLCVSLDDLVLNTPWGAKGAWADRPLCATFHADIGAGRFFDVLRQAQEKVATLRPVLELIHACLSLGMMGRYRGQTGKDAAGGAAEIERLRAEAAATLAATAPPPNPMLAARWEGVAMPFVARRRRLPVWVAASVGMAALGGLFLFLSLRLNDHSDALFARMLAAPPSHMPQVTRDAAPALPPAPVSEPTLQDRLRDRLAQAAAAGKLSVAGTAVAPIIRLPEKTLFAGPGATLQPDAAALIGQVADALRPEGGTLAVMGFTDNRAVRTVAFPSAFALSAARAQAVGAVLSRALGQAAQVRTEGRAGADPVASNATPDGREQNRRVDIVPRHPAS